MNAAYIKDVNSAFLNVCRLSGSIVVVEKLIASGANQFKYGLTLACINGHLPLVKYLAPLVPNVAYQLRASCLYKQVAVVRFLLSYGNSENKLIENSTFTSWPYIQAAFCAAESGCLEALQLLLPYSASMILPILTIACRKGHTTMADYIINQHKTEVVISKLVPELEQPYAADILEILKKYVCKYVSTNKHEAFVMLSSGLHHDNEFTKPLYEERKQRLECVDNALTEIYNENTMFDINILSIFNDYVPYNKT